MLVGISWSFQATLSKGGLYPDPWLPDQNEAEGRVVMPSKTKQEPWKPTKVTWQRERPWNQVTGRQTDGRLG